MDGAERDILGKRGARTDWRLGLIQSFIGASSDERWRMGRQKEDNHEGIHDDTLQGHIHIPSAIT